MYRAIMSRKNSSVRHGCYIKKFDTLEDIAKYIISSYNHERCYRLIGLTFKEEQILISKCRALFQRKCIERGS